MEKITSLSMTEKFVLTSLLFVLSVPPLNLWPFVFVAFVPWLNVVASEAFPLKKVVMGSTFLGFLYFVFFHHVYLVSAPYPWLGISPVVVWITVTGLLFVFGLLHGLGWGVYAWIARRLIVGRIQFFPVALSVLWVFFELILFRLNWNMGLSIGYVIPPQSMFGQLSSIGGVWFISFLVVLVNWMIVQEIKREKRIYFRFFFPVFMVICWYFVGWLFRANIEAIEVRGKSIEGVAIQVSNGEEKYSAETNNKYKVLLQEAQDGARLPQFFVIPETTYIISPVDTQLTQVSSPYFFSSFEDLQKNLVSSLTFRNLLLAGFVDYRKHEKLYNGALFLGDGNLETDYKRSLFPFGEFLPLKRLWSPYIQSAFRFVP
ncbi:MAG: hypothetical protein AAB611_01145, partial [Patescibacteria group bacterium]